MGNSKQEESEKPTRTLELCIFPAPALQQEGKPVPNSEQPMKVQGTAAPEVLECRFIPILAIVPSWIASE